MTYCVYVHRRKDDNRVFYVGMGKSDRPYKKRAGKSSSWMRVNFEAGGHTVQIFDDNLSKEMASELEEFLIDEASNLVNVHKTSCLTKEIPDFVSEYVYYDESSPTCLRWKKTTSNKSIKDSVAGSVKSSKVEIMILGNKFLGHRVVMKLHGNDNKHLTVNHKDCNPLNNRINNLELITQLENNNKKKSHIFNIPISRNRSGRSRISEESRKNKSGGITYYSVYRWVDDSGKCKCKTFSYIQNGILEAISKACEFRDNHIRVSSIRNQLNSKE